MTLGQLKDTIEQIVEGFEEIKTFQFGEDYLEALSNETEYPLVFLEIPYVTTYSLSNKQKTIQFALLVLMQSEDSNEDSHDSISKAENLGDLILFELQKNMQFKLTDANSLTVREFSDDSVDGVRIEIKGNTIRACKNC